MAQSPKTPGSVLNALIQKHDLNYNRLGKAIGLTSSLINMIARDKAPISVPVALRLATFFKTTPQFWTSVQTEFAIQEAQKDKTLAAGLKQITPVDRYVYERKAHKPPHESKAAKPGAKKPAAKKRSPGRNTKRGR